LGRFEATIKLKGGRFVETAGGIYGGRPIFMNPPPNPLSFRRASQARQEESAVRRERIPFESGKYKRIAVKVIDDRGIEN
jgi:hypothetical protein